MARRCKHLWHLVGVLATLACALAPAPARAYEETASLDATAGYLGLVDLPRLPTHGAVLDVGGSYGVGEAVVLRGALGYARLREHARRAHAGRVRLEGLYLIDVLRAVPFLGVGASLMMAKAPGGEAQLHPGAHLVVGLDYLWSRTLALGIDVRTGVLFDDGKTRSASEVGLRVSRMFELF